MTIHRPGQGKSATAYRTITEVAEELDVPQHVLRFWEGRFPQIRPVKRGGGRRYYRPADVEVLRLIRKLLYVDGYTIRGAQKVLRGGKADEPADRNDASEPPDAPDDGFPAAEEISQPEPVHEPELPLWTAAVPATPTGGLAPAQRDALWDILIELRILRGGLRR